MSAGLMPDIYRHTARKSTVTKALKSSLVNLSTKDKLYESIECQIKLEEEILPTPDEKFFILPNNEVEEMIVEERPFEQADEEAVVRESLEAIIDQLLHASSEQQMHSTDTNLDPSSNEIETQSSRSDDEIVEIDHSPPHPPPSSSCTCQCHQPDRFPSNDFFLFEQALRQARLEQEKLFGKNRLIQTLKRQHEELIQIYQQNKYSKPSSLSRIDREQQTNQLDRQDSPVQTDATTLTQKKPLSPQLAKMTATHSISKPSSTQQVLQPMIPRLPATNAHDIVDLTEEDDDDDDDVDGNHSSQISPPQAVSTRQSTSSILLPSPLSLPSTPTVPPATAPRNRPNHRATRPDNSAPPSQFVPLRPLPEQTPSDQTIARPQLSITQENATVRLTWNLQSTPMESIKNYEIYAYKQNATATASDWKKIGTVKSMRLPMAVTLREFQSNSHYAFAVRAICINNHIGPFCEAKTIFTGLNSLQPLHTSQLLNVSTK